MKKDLNIYEQRIRWTVCIYFSLKTKIPDYNRRSIVTAKTFTPEFVYSYNLPDAGASTKKAHAPQHNNLERL